MLLGSSRRPPPWWLSCRSRGSCSAPFSSPVETNILESGGTSRSMVSNTHVPSRRRTWSSPALNAFPNLLKGTGTQTWTKSGAVYSGEWKHGSPDGYGTYSVLLPETKEYAKKYCGDWKNGQKHVCTGSDITCMHQMFAWLFRFRGKGHTSTGNQLSMRGAGLRTVVLVGVRWPMRTETFTRESGCRISVTDMELFTMVRKRSWTMIWRWNRLCRMQKGD